MKVTSGRAYLNFGCDWRTDFTATISPEDMKGFRHAAVDPYRYAGKSVRVRGYIERMHGFEIQVSSPEAIEVLRQKKGPGDHPDLSEQDTTGIER